MLVAGCARPGLSARCGGEDNRAERVSYMRNALALGIYVCALGLAADAPYAGKWKMNVAKSDMGETTLTYEQMSGGEWKATMDGQTSARRSAWSHPCRSWRRSS